MFNRHKIIPTKEQSMRRIIVSLFFMVFGIYMLLLFNKTVGVICIITSSCTILFHLYFLIFSKDNLASIEIRVIAGKLPNDEKK